MLAEVPPTELDLLEWVKEKAINGRLTLTLEDNLPATWAELISSFTSLQKKGHFLCKVLPGPSCTLDLTISGNSKAVPSEHQSLTSPTTYKPNGNTLQLLKQYGFSRGQIADLLVQYLQKTSISTDSGFTSYCLNSDNSVIESVMTLRTHWNPSCETIEIMNSWGIPQEIHTELVEKYRQEFCGKRLDVADWNEHFLIQARKKWDCDNRNEGASEGTFMCANWAPSDTVMTQLVEIENMEKQWLETLAIEFRIYWNEVGSKRTNWNSQFIWWARRQWRARY